MKTKFIRAFTLIELLVTVSIIALLAGIATPIMVASIKKAREHEARTTAHILLSAIKLYQSEYSRYPSAMTGGDARIETDGGDPLVFVLLGQTKDGLNPRAARFLDYERMASDKRNGLVMDDESAALHDPWGSSYRVILDTSGDELIDNPDTENSEPRFSRNASSRLPAGIAVFSPGADREDGTRDDIVTWR